MRPIPTAFYQRPPVVLLPCRHWSVGSLHCDLKCWQMHTQEYSCTTHITWMLAVGNCGCANDDDCDVPACQTCDTLTGVCSGVLPAFCSVPASVCTASVYTCLFRILSTHLSRLAYCPHCTLVQRSCDKFLRECSSTHPYFRRD